MINWTKTVLSQIRCSLLKYIQQIVHKAKVIRYDSITLTTVPDGIPIREERKQKSDLPPNIQIPDTFPMIVQDQPSEVSHISYMYGNTLYDKIAFN